MTASGAQVENVAGNNYDKYASSNPLERRMMEGFFRALDGMLSGLSPDVVIEIGAGEGRITERLVERFPHATVVGLDLPDTDLAEEWDEIDVPMFFGDATRMPFVDRSIDLVVGLEVLEHIPHPERALADIARVCRGAAILSVPREPIWRVGNIARGRYVTALGNTPRHVHHWSAKRFERFVAGRFDVTDVAKPLPWTMLRATPRQLAKPLGSPVTT